MKAVLEGLLFVVGDEGLSLNDLKSLINLKEEDILDLLDELKDDYKKEDRGITLEYLGNHYKLTTKSIHKDYYEKLNDLTSIKTLSQASLETLAIIAYNAPITRAKIDELRGVNSSQIVRNLLARNFIKELGKSNTLNRPMLYGVTDEFLDYFGLSSIADLPQIDLDEDITGEVDLYNSKYEEAEFL